MGEIPSDLAAKITRTLISSDENLLQLMGSSTELKRQFAETMDPTATGVVRISDPPEWLTSAARQSGINPRILSQLADRTGLFDGPANVITNEENRPIGFIGRPTGSTETEILDINLRRVADVNALRGNLAKPTINALTNIALLATGAVGVFLSSYLFTQPYNPQSEISRLKQEIDSRIRRNAILLGDAIVGEEEIESEFATAPPLTGQFSAGPPLTDRDPPPYYDTTTVFTGDPGPGATDFYTPQYIPPIDRTAERALMLENIRVEENKDKNNRAYNRVDSLQTRTATNRIANLETPLYDYSQSGSRIRGLQNGNRPVII